MKTDEQLMKELDDCEAYNKPIGRAVFSAIGTPSDMHFQYGNFEDLKKGGVYSFIEKCETQFINCCLILTGMSDNDKNRPLFISKWHEDFCAILSGKKAIRNGTPLDRLPFWKKLKEKWNALSEADKFYFLD